MRLAFAVAAHLEPEILVVDEVLAVGDRGISRRNASARCGTSPAAGRTVLFVSHNMQAVRTLCVPAGFYWEVGYFSLMAAWTPWLKLI